MNLSQLRTDVRARLMDASVGGIWSDAQLTTALSSAHGHLAPRFPTMISTPLAVTAGATSAAVAGLGRVALVRDAAGLVLPEFEVRDAPPYLAYAVVGDELRFSRALTDDEAGSWTVDAWSDPVFPPDDVTEVALPASVLGAMVALACAAAIRGEASDSVRRGRKVAGWLPELAREFDREAMRTVTAHFRRARGGRLGSA